MKKWLKRNMALLLAVCLCAALIVPTASAVEYEGVPGKVNLTVTANEQADSSYNVSYNATLNMPVGLANAAAFALDHTKLAEFRFVCTLTDTIIEADTRTGDVQGLYTIGGEGSSFYEFISAVKDGNKVIMTYKLKQDVIDSWKNEQAETKSANLQKTVVFTSKVENVPASHIKAPVTSTATVDVTRTSDGGTTYKNIIDADGHAAIGTATVNITKYVAPSGPSTPGTPSTPSTPSNINITNNDQGETGSDTTPGGVVTILTPDPKTGDTVKFNIDPNPGKHVTSVTVTDKNGDKVVYNYEGKGNFDFVMPEGTVQIVVNYDDNPYLPNDSGVSELLNTDEHILYIRGDKVTRLVRTGDNVKRSEVATMFYRLLRKPNVLHTIHFDDVTSDGWYYEAVNVIAALGVFNGYGDGTFRPYNPMTRAEFFKTCVGFASKEPTRRGKTFTDAAGSWAYDSIMKASAYGWINGYPGGAIRPNDYITRIECMIVINKMLGRPADSEAIDQGKGTQFPDLSTSYWGYNDVEEASTEHDPELDEIFYTEGWENILAQH